jgi:hypothetical protein
MSHSMALDSDLYSQRTPGFGLEGKSESQLSLDSDF